MVSLFSTLKKKIISWIIHLFFYNQLSRITYDFSVYWCGFFIQLITSVQRYTYVRFVMKNLIRSKEEQLRKQEAEIAKKTHEKLYLSSSSHRHPKILQATGHTLVSFAASFVRQLPSGITKSSLSVTVHSTLLKIIRSSRSLDVSRYSENSWTVSL